MEKFELKRPSHDYRYFDMEQFSEAIFILAFSDAMLPRTSKMAEGRALKLKDKCKDSEKSTIFFYSNFFWSLL